MLIIKRIDGQIKYAYDATLTKKSTKVDEPIIPLPKLPKPSYKMSLIKWYHINYFEVERIIESYVDMIDAFSGSHPKNSSVLDIAIFREQIIEKLYATSLNTAKKYEY